MEEFISFYAMPQKLVNLVIDQNNTSKWFDIKAEMTRTTRGCELGVRWRFTSNIDGFGFADDVAIKSSTWAHMQQRPQE